MGALCREIPGTKGFAVKEAGSGAAPGPVLRCSQQVGTPGAGVASEVFLEGAGWAGGCARPRQAERKGGSVGGLSVKATRAPGHSDRFLLVLGVLPIDVTHLLGVKPHHCSKGTKSGSPARISLLYYRPVLLMPPGHLHLRD